MRLIKLQEVMEKTSLSRSTLYRYMANGKFPKLYSLEKVL